MAKNDPQTAFKGLSTHGCMPGLWSEAITLEIDQIEFVRHQASEARQVGAANLCMHNLACDALNTPPTLSITVDKTQIDFTISMVSLYCIVTSL